MVANAKKQPRGQPAPAPKTRKYTNKWVMLGALIGVLVLAFFVHKYLAYSTSRSNVDMAITTLKDFSPTPAAKTFLGDGQSLRYCNAANVGPYKKGNLFCGEETIYKWSDNDKVQAQQKLRQFSGEFGAYLSAKGYKSISDDTPTLDNESGSVYGKLAYVSHDLYCDGDFQSPRGLETTTTLDCYARSTKAFYPIKN